MSAKTLADKLQSIIGINAEKQGITSYLDTGLPGLNHVLSGSYFKGAPTGRMIEIFGPASCGKTFLATMIMMAAQKAGGIAGFSDHERSFEPIFAQQLGLDTGTSGHWVYKRPQTFEESVEIAIAFCEGVREQELIPPDAPLVWCFDSVAAMIPHEKLYDKDGNRRPPGSYNMRDSLSLAKATSQSYPILSQFAEDNNMLVLLLNQIRMKPGVMYGDPTTTPGGQAAEFFASTRLSIGKKNNKDKKSTKEIIGFDITAKTTKNKVARPFVSTSWNVIFEDKGGCFIDLIATNLQLVLSLGLLEVSGAWITWEGKKYQTTGLVNHLKTLSDGNEQLMQLLRDYEDSVKTAA